MENLIFSLDVRTVPIFLLMILGLLFHKIGWIDDVFAQKMNKFVFVVPLPVLVFSDLATVDFHEVWNMKFVLFCFLATFLSITLVSFMSLGLKERALRGEFTSGVLQKQCCTSWNCIYTEYIRKCRNGTG